MNLVELESVGCVIDENGVTYPMLVDGGYDEDGGFHVNDIENEEWFDALSQEDIDTIDCSTPTILVQFLDKWVHEEVAKNPWTPSQ